MCWSFVVVVRRQCVRCMLRGRDTSCHLWTVTCILKAPTSLVVCALSATRSMWYINLLTVFHCLLASVLKLFVLFVIAEEPASVLMLLAYLRSFICIHICCICQTHFEASLWCGLEMWWKSIYEICLDDIEQQSHIVVVLIIGREWSGMSKVVWMERWTTGWFNESWSHVSGRWNLPCWGFRVGATQQHTRTRADSLTGRKGQQSK